MNLWDLLILVGIAGTVALGLRSLRSRKRGGCSGCCGDCPGCGAAHPDETAQTKE